MILYLFKDTKSFATESLHKFCKYKLNFVFILPLKSTDFPVHYNVWSGASAQQRCDVRFGINPVMQLDR